MLPASQAALASLATVSHYSDVLGGVRRSRADRDGAQGARPHAAGVVNRLTGVLDEAKIRDIVGLYMAPPDKPWCSA